MHMHFSLIKRKKMKIILFSKYYYLFITFIVSSEEHRRWRIKFGIHVQLILQTQINVLCVKFIINVFLFFIFNFHNVLDFFLFCDKNGFFRNIFLTPFILRVYNVSVILIFKKIFNETLESIEGTQGCYEQVKIKCLG